MDGAQSGTALAVRPGTDITEQVQFTRPTVDLVLAWLRAYDETNPTPQPSPPRPATPADPDGVVPDPAATATPGPTATTSGPTGSPTPPADPSPEASAGSGPAGEDGGDQPVDDGDGVVLGDGLWIPWAVAAAVAAAMAVVWLQRRRRYRPHRLDQVDADTAELYLEQDPDPATFDEPATVSRIRRALRTRRGGEAPPPADEPEPGPEPDPVPGTGPQPWPEAAPLAPLAGVGHGEQPAPGPAPVPAVEPLPEGGTGIVGPGAEAAALGALVAALSAGAPVDPDAQTEVILPADAMVTLLGADAVTLGTGRRLRVAPTWTPRWPWSRPGCWPPPGCSTSTTWRTWPRCGPRLRPSGRCRRCC